MDEQTSAADVPGCESSGSLAFTADAANLKRNLYSRCNQEMGILTVR